jgi:hypothetical protein
MKTLFALTAALVCSASPIFADKLEEGFVALFDGKSLDGWKVNENKESFKIEDGAIVAEGERSHAFYVGDVKNAKFQDFELRLDVMTRPSANGGVFIHTEFQKDGWPGKGYEVQVNNTQSDWRKSGGLYAVVDNKEPFEDNTWMKYVIIVQDGVVKVSINGKELVNYKAQEGKSKLLEGGGTIALQAHDPGSKIYYKNIRIKPLD